MPTFPIASASTPVNRSTDITTNSSAIRLQVQAEGGRTQTVHYPGLTLEQAKRRASSQGWRVIGVESELEAPMRAGSAGGATGNFSLLLFSQELLALLEAGLNLTEALATLQAKERQAKSREILSTILRGVREGKNYSDVLDTLPEYFPAVYVATVRASERTGDLPQSLRRYIAYQQQFDTLRKKLVSAAIYPVMLMIVGAFVALFLLGYVVPKFSAVYESSGRDMPWMSEVLLSFGKTIHAHGIWVLAGLAVGLGMLFLWLRHPRGRASLRDTVLRMPWLAEKALEFRLARFYRAVSLLLAAGVALPRALAMVGGMLSLPQQQALAAARLSVDQGKSLSDALQAVDLTTPVALSLIKVGERSGQLADMLERAAKFHDEDFARWVDWASRLLEPILMTVIGVVIGAIVVLMYMPIFELAGSLQ
jgi:general secretion pathway protein F